MRILRATTLAQHAREEGLCFFFLVIHFLRFSCHWVPLFLSNCGDSRRQHTVSDCPHIVVMLSMLEAHHQLVANMRLHPVTCFLLNLTVRTLLHQLGTVAIADGFDEFISFSAVISQQLLDLLTVAIWRRLSWLLALAVIGILRLPIQLEELAILRRCLPAHPTEAHGDIVIWGLIIVSQASESYANFAWRHHLAFHLLQVASVVVEQEVDWQQVKRQAKQNCRKVSAEAWVLDIEADLVIVNDAN